MTLTGDDGPNQIIYRRSDAIDESVEGNNERMM